MTPDLARATGDCATCAATTGTKRYCAPARCYCGHADCPAVDSYVDINAIPLWDAQPPARPARRSSWDDRKDSTWIDKL